jgi:RNA polymerase sigma-70 factor (ECF subfamily)
VVECLARYGGLVWTIALRWLGNDRSEAEDMTQEIFVDIWKSAGRFDPNLSSETTFVTLIARRRLIDRRRRQARHAIPADLPGAVTCPRSLDPDRLEIEDEAAQALRALADIEPEQRRRILLMAIHQGLTHEQIAQTMRLPLGTVKTHARRGLLELRAKLQDANLSSRCKGVSR